MDFASAAPVQTETSGGVNFFKILGQNSSLISCKGRTPIRVNSDMLQSIILIAVHVPSPCEAPSRFCIALTCNERMPLSFRNSSPSPKLIEAANAI